MSFLVVVWWRFLAWYSHKPDWQSIGGVTITAPRVVDIDTAHSITYLAILEFKGSDAVYVGFVLMYLTGKDSFVVWRLHYLQYPVVNPYTIGSIKHFSGSPRIANMIFDAVSFCWDNSIGAACESKE